MQPQPRTLLHIASLSHATMRMLADHSKELETLRQQRAEAISHAQEESNDVDYRFNEPL